MVEFLGQLSHKKVMEYMAVTDIFSLPSWNEAFGVVYIEAMAQGKPVIGCQGEGIEDFVEDGKTGLLAKPKDVDSLVKALDFLLSHPTEAQEIGKRAGDLVLKHYTWEKNAEKTIEVYQEVLNNVR
jgi:glycosyltransferase involved in cell wall biosynthesis